jgi:ChrR-like protein with cupin domain
MIFAVDPAMRTNDDTERAPESKTLGDLLYAKQTERPTSEAVWISAVRSIAEGDQLALQWIYELTHRIVFTLIMRILNPEENQAIEIAFFFRIDVPGSSGAIESTPRNYQVANSFRIGQTARCARPEIGRRMSSRSDKHDEDHLETATLYALQALSASEISVFEDHLSTCAECLREIETLRPIINSFASWPTDVLRPPSSLWKRLSQRISNESGAKLVSPAARQPSKHEWEKVADGLFCKLLAVDAENSRVTMLVRLAPGTEYPPHRHAIVEELHLLHVELMIDDKKLQAGDFSRAEAGSVDHRVWSETGCTCVLLTSTRDAIL